MPRKPTKVVESTFDDVFDTAIVEAQKKYPTEVYTGSEEVMRSICLPVPSLAIRYLYQQEGLPLGRFYLLDGAKESCKSAMSYEMIRWTRMLGGRGMVLEVEDKRSPELADSILEYDPKALTVQRCTTMEEWHTALTQWIKKIRLLMDGVKGAKGVGRKVPFGFIIDSIMAAQVQEVVDKIQDEGHTGRRFASEAFQLSDYLKYITKEVSDFPYFIVGINHIKEKPAEGYGQRGDQHNMPGGKAPGYHASVDVKMSRNGSQKRFAEHEAISLFVETKKNSSAPHAKIKVDMVWKMDDQPTASGEYLQRTWFDWSRSTFDMLDQCIEDFGEARRNKLRDVFRFGCKKGQNQVWSAELGVSEKDPVTFDQAHQLLEEKISKDDDFRKQLYAVLGIRTRPLFQAGVDLRDQMSEVREHVRTLQEDRIVHVRSCPTQDFKPVRQDDDDSPDPVLEEIDIGDLPEVPGDNNA